MSDTDVLRVVDALSKANIQFWLAGGWGVEALNGTSIRPHGDVDVVLDNYGRDREKASEALAMLEYKFVEDFIGGRWMPKSWRLHDGLGHRVELLSIDYESIADAMRLSDAPGGAVAVGDDVRSVLFEEGRIAGRPVPCLSLRAQLLFHSGFELRPTDFGDLHLLGQMAAACGMSPGFALDGAAIGSPAALNDPSVDRCT